MSEIVTCPHCKKRLQLSSEHMGMQVQCPSCETAFTAGEAPAPVIVGAPTPGAIKTPRTAIPDMSLDPAPDTGKSAKQPRDEDDAPLPPRAKRRSLPPRPKEPSNYRKPILFAVLGVLVLVGVVIGIASNRGHVRPPNPIVFNDVEPREWQMPPRSDVPDRMLDANERMAQANAFFQHFGEQMRNNRAANELASYDSRRMLEVMFEQKLLPEAWRNDSEVMLRTIRERITTLPLNPIDRWVHFEIKQAKQTQPRELMVVTRHTKPGLPGALRFRWWLKHDGTRWLIQELEDIDYGIRMTTLLALTLEPIPNNTGVFPHAHLRPLSDAADGILKNDNFGEAVRILKDSRTDDLPAPFLAMHHMILASGLVRQRLYPETARHGEAVQKAHPDMPGNDYVLSLALSNLNRNDEALKLVKQAYAWLGDDPDICYQIGFTLHNLRRYTEAAVQYRKVLDTEPEHKNAFLSLIRIVGPEVKNDDIAERFERLKNPQERFELYANDCWTHRDVSTVEILASSMRRRMPRYAEAEFYYALVMADRHKVPEALASFKNALNLQLDAQRKQFYCSEFARTMTIRDHAFETYAAMPNAVEAFRTVAESLKNAARTDDLQRLIDLHAKTHPADSYVLLYRAEIQLREEKYALADASFTQALAKINDPGVAERFRPERVRTRYQLGDIAGAYRDIGPQRMTFQQLGDLCWLDKKYDELQTLIDLHAKNDAPDQQIARFRCRLDFVHKRFDAAGKRLRAAIGPNPHDQQIRILLEDFLFDAVDANQALEGYRQCPNPALALEIIANDLMDSNQPKVLDEILDEHRKKHPDDPLLSMLIGEQASARKDWAKAAAAFKAGWDKTPEQKRLRWSNAYLQAHAKLGQALQVHQETGMRFDYFRQLASLLLLDKNIDQFEKLVQAHRIAGGKDAEFSAYEARLQILRGKPADAAQTMNAYLKDLPQPDQRRIGDSFANDLGNFDVSAEAYRCIPNKVDAFAQMAWKYRTVERAPELERLILAHAKYHPTDPRLASERGELHLLRGEFAKAEAQFMIAAKNDQVQNFSLGRQGLIRARIKLGKAAETYVELGKTTLAFQDIANQCVIQKNADQLEQVIAAHRKAFPNMTNLAIWDLDANWLKKDYEKTIAAIRADNSALLKSNVSKWKCESYLVRGLVRQNKHAEAIREAEELNKRKHGPQVLLALAYASSGDVKRTVAYLGSITSNRYLIEDCYHDEDLGAVLRSDAYRDFQKRYPPPPPRPNAP